MNNKLSKVLLGLGIVMLAAAGALLLYNRAEDARAGEAAGEIVTQLQAQVPETTQAAPAAAEAEAETTAEETEPIDPKMTEVTLNGWKYIGYVAVPSLELELPVMTDWSYEQLQISPCRYSGSVKTDNLVLMAHNYAQHFGKLKELKPGDTVTFTDMDGTVWDYAVTLLETLEPTAMEEMVAGTHDLTLFTCTYGGQSRVALRCDRVGRKT